MSPRHYMPKPGEIVDPMARRWQLSVKKIERGGWGALRAGTLSFTGRFGLESGEYQLTEAETNELEAHRDDGFRKACERLAASREPDSYQIRSAQ